LLPRAALVKRLNPLEMQAFEALVDAFREVPAEKFRL
jgi:hypothetical protein